MPDPSQYEPPLAFDWRKPRPQWPRLAFWLVIAVFGLGAFFALFRVVYPQTQRFIPTTQQVTLLAGNDPATRAVLNTVQDRDFMILVSSAGKKEAVSLEEKAPVFHPSFENHELKLQDLPQRDTKPAPVRLLDVTAPVLPRLDLSELRRGPAPASPGASTGLKLLLGGALATRAIAFQPDFSGLKLPDPEAWRFHLGVDARGRVILALPVDAPGKLEEAAPLLQLLRQIRFSAAADPGENPVWGAVELRWTASTTP